MSVSIDLSVPPLDDECGGESEASSVFGAGSDDEDDDYYQSRVHRRYRKPLAETIEKAAYGKIRKSVPWCTSRMSLAVLSRSTAMALQAPLQHHFNSAVKARRHSLSHHRLQQPSGLPYLKLSPSYNDTFCGEPDFPCLSQHSPGSKRTSKNHHRSAERSSPLPKKRLSTITADLRPRTSFDHLVRSEKFDGIVQVLELDQMSPEAMARWLYKNCSNGETPLHKLLTHRPTLEVVDLMIKKLTELTSSSISRDIDAAMHEINIPETSCDDSGRNPLHIAAYTGCSISVLDRLLDGVLGVMPIYERDKYGRLPIHYACCSKSSMESYLASDANTLTTVTESLLLNSSFSSTSSQKSFCQSVQNETSRSILSYPLSVIFPTSTRRPGSKYPMEAVNTDHEQSWALDTIRVLLCRYPESVTISDASGQTPLDLAKHCNAPHDILDFLEKVKKRTETPIGHRVDRVQQEEINKDKNDAREDHESCSPALPIVEVASAHEIHSDGVSSLGCEEAGQSKNMDVSSPPLSTAVACSVAPPDTDRDQRESAPKDPILMVV